MWDYLKQYPNKTSLVVGNAIGFIAFTVSTALCGFFTVCTDTNLDTNPDPSNPAAPFAAFVGSLFVGAYCGWLTEGKLKFLVAFVVTLLMMFAVLLSGIRGYFDSLLGGESFLSHSLFYGVITLILVGAITSLNKGGQSQN